MRTKISKADRYESMYEGDVKCPVCGKIFFPAPYHVYHMPASNQRVCSYHCKLQAEKNHEERVTKNRKDAQKRRWEREKQSKK